ncbi:ribosome recycling factor [Helicovermis profundi]|uniref:Ribosome-recycling factor n=1 Tax=Helicovermis profundi TaxID=3065157 RepID=A0AAU9EDB3_9FIRM|nr:ribosome recycling factor [Clostridia bacterium S502]
MPSEIFSNLEEKMTKTVSVLKNELHSIRAGRANPSLLDRIMVEYYGSKTPLKQVAAVSAPEPRLLQVSPYDVTALKDIERALIASDLGINPSNDGKIIRLAIPMLTEERRKSLTKVVKKTGEDSKVALRNERRRSNDLLKKMHKDNDITEDELKESNKKVEELIKKYSEIVDKLIEQKEKEILAV